MENSYLGFLMQNKLRMSLPLKHNNIYWEKFFLEVLDRYEDFSRELKIYPYNQKKKRSCVYFSIEIFCEIELLTAY